MSSAAPPAPPARRGLAWLAALGLSLLLHAALLWPRSIPQPSPRPAGVALQTRPMPLPSTAAALPPEPVAIARSPPRRAAARMAPGLPAATAPPPAAEPVPPAPPLAIAPPLEWLYLLSQQGRQGLARLSWQPQLERGAYVLSLERELDGRALPGWRSQGALDAQQGLSPQRYALQRPGRDGLPRDRQATNFRRDEGLISFSASAELVALPAGVQDRLSSWLQLAALVAGAPQRFGPGSEIRLPVVGLRGEAREQLFEVVGEEALTLPRQLLASTLHLRRAPLGPYESGLELWLDPARGHLPVRLLASGGLEGAPGWELQLIEDNGKR
ncbi:DUF3108 domain-containing protein [Roseateles violae]|uniref:DUF3108 domain-containing protein n=1 Tax=Roseateles violae TaxID=3058042 RepID=A0ABT8DNJ3_9BURK|nr:DUF3108 domain-containing protein [Pelomonas sp. PFR6]MDN3919566.1 DUF3108 domain-containing protein [Pelomonas sp. PFR6]